jgi:nucleotide-binding universal stress UspA family protein
MRRILAVLNHLDTASAVLAAAGLLARRLPAARIDVLHVRPANDPSFIPSEEVMTPARKARFAAEAAVRTAELQRIFAASQQADGASVHSTWREVSGPEAECVAREAARADLLAIGQAAHHEPGDGKATIMAAVFGSPPPVVLVPARVPAILGAHIAIAWKPSGPAERAATAALPLLRQAARVTVLLGGEATQAAGGADELLSILAAANLVPGIHPFAAGHHAIGRALLREAHAVGADLLVMGAYAHSPTLEALLGGATRDILAEADLPVFMQH